VRHLLPHILIAVLLIAPAASAAEKSKGKKGGKRRASVRLNGQYKRAHQRLLKQILAGKSEAAATTMEKILAAHPDDGETHFMMAVARAQLGQLDKSHAATQQAVQHGVPLGRFVAGPRNLLAPLSKHGPIRKWVEKEFAHRPVHGPMLGDVGSAAAKVWIRTDGQRKVECLVRRAKSGTKIEARFPFSQPTAETDFTAICQLEGLSPATEYEYAVSFVDRPQGGEVAHQWHAFRTPPEAGKPVKFTFAFGGGAGYVPERERMWTTIAKAQPDALMLLGDNVYIDDPTTPEMQKYCYYRRQSRPEFEKLIAQTAVYSIWDDHDFAKNDSSGGPKIDEPAWKRPVWNVFRQNWANPGYGGGKKQPGCWYKFSRGDVEFFMLDCRYYRTPPRGTPEDQRSMLGPVQLQWLLEGLSQSKATLKIIASSVPMAKNTKGGSQDTWDGFDVEREKIFRHLAKNNITGVLIISADRHRSDAYKIDRTDQGGYPLYEFNSSKLTNQHTHGTIKHALFSYNKKNSYGLVHIDTTADDPTVRYDVINIDGERVHSLNVKRSELK